ncbi:uncharacterized protein METZ01_LOCUS142588 [marine metagenome]|uniref:Uncharacterized protein n=1 Tax=marine metagenome TaxID=408172 RepID=A0A381ZKQ5_9ZZZZ
MSPKNLLELNSHGLAIIILVGK